MNIFENLTIAFTAVLVISMIIDLRRFRNGFYLLGAILNGMISADPAAVCSAGTVNV